MCVFMYNIEDDNLKCAKAKQSMQQSFKTFYF